MIKRILCMALALTMLCACALAQTAYVDNGSDPQSRLNMRGEPSAEAASLGRFYSGTQVEVLGDAGGGWSQVSIAGSSGLNGYMMSAYLSADMAGVLDARQEKRVASPYGTPSVVLRDKPSNSYGAVAMLAVGETVKVIGVSGDFCFVLRGDGAVGCLAAEELK